MIKVHKGVQDDADLYFVLCFILLFLDSERPFKKLLHLYQPQQESWYCFYLVIISVNRYGQFHSSKTKQACTINLRDLWLGSK